MSFGEHVIHLNDGREMGYIQRRFLGLPLD